MLEDLSIGKILSEKKYEGTGLISEKTEALYLELNKKAEAATNNLSSIELLINHDSWTKHLDRIFFWLLATSTE